MQGYEKIDIKIIVFESDDVITNSQNESADDFGQWNDGWFAKNND